MMLTNITVRYVTVVCIITKNVLIYVVIDNVLPESQCGFWAGRDTTDMIFAMQQIQQKCREQNQDLYMVFIDLTKAFYLVNRTGFWKLLANVGCPYTFVDVIRSFHDGMMARVQNKGSESNAFTVSLSENAMIDDDISDRLRKASASLGRLTKCLWNERGVCLSTKINVYCAVVLTTLLYGCETWNPYR